MDPRTATFLASSDVVGAIRSAPSRPIETA
jgi:hypothetical protein